MTSDSTTSDLATNKFRKKMRSNRTFRAKVHWYRKGQRRCHCCGVQLHWQGDLKNSATVEHLVPQSKGGTSWCGNIIMVCTLCNKKRGNSNWIDWVLNYKLPKDEWLIGKYLAAVEHYRVEETNLNLAIFQDVAEYKKRLARAKIAADRKPIHAVND